MAYASVDSRSHPVTRGGAAKNLFWRVWDYLVSLSASNARLKAVERLQALSDEELERIGLRREDIVRHVFADKYYL